MYLERFKETNLVIFGNKEDVNVFIDSNRFEYRILGRMLKEVEVSNNNYELSFEDCIRQAQEEKIKIVVVGKKWKNFLDILSSHRLLSHQHILFDWMPNENMVNYEELYEMAKRGGYTVFDYIFVISLFKKITCVYGNQQSKRLAMMLGDSPLGKENIILYISSEKKINFENETELNSGSVELFSHFLYQTEYNIFNTIDKIKNDLNRDCISLSFPNLFFSGYFPQLTSNSNNVLLKSAYNEKGIVPFGDIIIQNMIEDGLTDDEIFESAMDLNLYDTAFVHHVLSESISKMYNDEDGSNIKIADYVRNNYKEECLFNSPDSPSNTLLLELCKKIITTLGHSDKYETRAYEEDNNFEMIIYPSVKTHLGLKFTKDKYHLCKNYDPVPIGKIGYIRQYRLFCYPETIKKVYSEMSRDISSEIKMDKTYLTMRKPSLMTISGSTVHLSLYLNMLTDLKDVRVMSIPERYAPPSSCILLAFIINGPHRPLELTTKGELIFNITTGKKETLIVNATWNIV